MCIKKKLNIKRFTLIELIIVIVVIGVLAGMALPKFIGVERNAKVSAMDQDLDTLEKAVQLYESNNDGAKPFIKDGSGNYTKVSITRQTLKDTLDAIGDDESQVYTLDMASLKPYLERLKYTDSTTDTYLYSTKTGVAINEQGKIDSSGITHHILSGGINSTFTNNSISTKSSFKLITCATMGSDSFIMDKENNIYGWGVNFFGRIGDGTNSKKYSPTKITLASGVKPTKIVEGPYQTMAIGDDGNLYSWGTNWHGELGNGTDKNNYVPTKIELASGVKPKEIACGNGFSMAIGDDKELYTWGCNQYATLGIGTSDSNLHAIPTKITLATGIKPVHIACGLTNPIAIGSDGELYTWGNYKLTPTKTTLSEGVKPIQIACGDYHSVAIGSNGELYTWGKNDYGQLGDGTYMHNNNIVKITLPNGVKPTQISCGESHSVAIGSDGEVYAWGHNSCGQLGDGTTTDKNTPTKITLENGIKSTQIICYSNFVMAIGDNGGLYAWGNNVNNELGDETYENKKNPIKISPVLY